MSKKLEQKHINAMYQIKEREDILLLPLARLLREVEKLNPEFIKIGDLHGVYDGAKKLPYFGAHITTKGKEFLTDMPETHEI